ncbi:MAG: phosphopantothenoylcysteine decarboxylase [Cyanobium sp.]
MVIATSSYHGWDGQPPRSAAIGDHDVPLDSHHLQGRRIALVVTGGIAALRSPDLARALRRRGAEVTAFCTRDALPFVGRQALEWATCRPVIRELSWRAEHLSDSEPFDAWLVAPATANTLAKLVCGIADTPVSSALASALGRMEQGLTQLLLAPTLHGSLHTSILTAHARRLTELGVQLIAPRDAYGKHNLPDLPVLVACVCRALSASPLRGRPILVTGGPTPVPIDAVRRLVNRFSGRLALAIAEELLLRGADPQLLLGEGSAPAPGWLPHEPVASYDAYRRRVLELVAAQPAAAILSAAVADYQPRRPHAGKLPSGQTDLRLELEPTAKVIDLVRAAAPALPMVTFKVLQGVDDGALLAEARRRLQRFQLVVANHAERVQGEAQEAWLVSAAGAECHHGKRAIAAAIVDWLETHLPAALPHADPPGGDCTATLP